MDIQVCGKLTGRKLEQWKNLMLRSSLEPDTRTDITVLVWEGEQLVAAGSRLGNLLKCIAVEEAYQGMDLTATVLTQLRQDAFEAGFTHLFLYTKPKNLLQFSSLFFYPVAQTEQVLLMESEPNGIVKFLETLPVPHKGGKVGALVMNCNPFTLGHRYLIETAASHCDHLYVFVLSEDKGYFRTADRLEMVKRGTAHLPNVTVLLTGPYLISSATFPTYFLKNRDQAENIHCQLDVEVFARHFAPAFHIQRRYVGTEPLSAMTNQYNEVLKASLPPRGIEVIEIPRLTKDDTPISASAVREAYNRGDWTSVMALVPATTYDYLQQEVTP